MAMLESARVGPCFTGATDPAARLTRNVKVLGKLVSPSQEPDESRELVLMAVGGNCQAANNYVLQNQSGIVSKGAESWSRKQSLVEAPEFF